MYNIKMTSNVLIRRHNIDDYANAITNEQSLMNQKNNSALLEFYDGSLEYESHSVQLEMAKEYISSIENNVKCAISKVTGFLKEWCLKIEDFVVNTNKDILNRISQIFKNENNFDLGKVSINASDVPVSKHNTYFNNMLSQSFDSNLEIKDFKEYVDKAINGGINSSLINNFSFYNNSVKEQVEGLLDNNHYYGYINSQDIQGVYDRFTHLAESLNNFRKGIEEYIQPFEATLEEVKLQNPDKYLQYSNDIQNHINGVIDLAKYNALAVEKVAKESVILMKQYIIEYDKALLEG